MDVPAQHPPLLLKGLGATLEDCDRPLFPIGVVAEHLGVSDQTLRLYELKGLVQPARRNGERYYSPNDVQWLRCLRRLIHGEKVSVEGVRMLLRYAPCWEIAGLCSREAFPCEGCAVYWKGRGSLPGRRNGSSR